MTTPDNKSQAQLNAHPGVKICGAPSHAEVKRTPGYPKEEIWRKGPVAFIECVEEIPCNPCEGACPQGAITVGSPITNLPVLDAEKCRGCNICLALCPGLAIYVKDYTYSDTKAKITFPYEYWPLPSKGQQVTLVDELGEAVCPGHILQVTNTERNKQTPLITAAFPKEYFERVKSMERLRS